VSFTGKEKQEKEEVRRIIGILLSGHQESKFIIRRNSNISLTVAQSLRLSVYVQVIWLLNVWEIPHLNFSRFTKNLL